MLPMLANGPYHLKPSLHHGFNKSLPIEIIEIIVNYLSVTDLWHLAISKLFLPALFLMPKFFHVMNKWFLHTLCHFFNNRSNMFLKCVYIPIVFDNNFYIAVNTHTVSYMKYCGIKKGYGLDVAVAPFTMIFNAFDTKKSKIDTSFFQTHCICKHYKYIHIHNCLLKQMLV